MNKYTQLFSILPVTAHTDFVTTGSTFVATEGAKLNGIDYIPLALQKGATKIIIQKDSRIPEEIKQILQKYNPEIAFVDNVRQALSELSAKAWDYPAKKLKIIGITGTKGKTTSTFLLHHILSCAGYKTAMISGVFNVINGTKYETILTSPLPDYLHAFFAKCVQENVEYVVMEAAAQAFSLKRFFDIEFSGAIFTNLDLEHSEFYSSMDDYFAAKCQLFEQIKNSSPAIINLDNTWSAKLAKTNNTFLTISSNDNASYRFQILNDGIQGVKISLNENIFHAPNLMGNFNAYNLTGVIAMALELNINPTKIKNALLNFEYVPGRMERYQLSNGATAIIDYAHNPSSFSQLLPTLKKLTNDLIVVFGCGGDRDKQKRPIMGQIASSIADKIIITSDNPRSEKPQEIIEQISSGILKENQNKVICEIDRAKAIETAYKISKEKSIIVLLGKGPDEYQIIGNNKFYFSDKETILNI